MNKPIMITLVICLGIPFLLSFRSYRPRSFRRKAVIIGFIVMLIVASSLPLDPAIALAQNDSSSTADAGSITDEDPLPENTPSEPVEAIWYAASEIDLSGYTVVSCADGSASATNYLVTQQSSYPAQNIFDGNITSCWQDGVDGNGEDTEITVSLSESCEIRYIVISNGRASSDQLFEENGRVFQLEISTVNHPTKVVELPDENIPIAISMDDWGIVSTEIMFKIISVYPGSKYADTCISEMVFYR